MRFAPQDGQLVVRQFDSIPATAAWLAIWTDACKLAEVYWDRIAQEPRVSADFQQLSAQSLSVLRAMPRRGAPVSTH
jgi:hypothetical protein